VTKNIQMEIEEWRQRVMKGRGTSSIHFSEPKEPEREPEEEEPDEKEPEQSPPVVDKTDALPETHARAPESQSPYRQIYYAMTRGIGISEDVEAFRWAVSNIGEHICSLAVGLELNAIRLERSKAPEEEYRAAVKSLVEFMLDLRQKWKDRDKPTGDEAA